MQFDRSNLTPEARTLYAAARQLADLVWEHLSPNVGADNWAQDWRWQGANSAHNQTATGLFLEFVLGKPSVIWTPWGAWRFCAGGPSMRTLSVDEIMSHLRTTVHQEQHETSMGWLGPAYAIWAIDGEQLPEPTLITDEHEYLEYNIARQMWEQLTKDWCDANGITPPAKPQP